MSTTTLIYQIIVIVMILAFLVLENNTMLIFMCWLSIAQLQSEILDRLLKKED